MCPYCLGDYLRLTTIQLIKAGLLMHVVIFALHFILFIYVFLFLHCQKGKTFLKKENIFSLLSWLSQLRDCASYRKPFKNLNSLKPLNLWLIILDMSCMVQSIFNAFQIQEIQDEQKAHQHCVHLVSASRNFCFELLDKSPGRLKWRWIKLDHRRLRHFPSRNLASLAAERNICHVTPQRLPPPTLPSSASLV